MNAISLESLHQSTVSLISDIIHLKRKMLFILNHQDVRYRTFKIYPLYKICIHVFVNAISLKSFPPIDFKLEIRFHIIYRTDAIDSGPSAQIKIAANELFKVKMYAIDTFCEHDIEPFYQSTSHKI